MLHALTTGFLRKQRVEAKQIYGIITDRTTTKSWRNHPAVLMWMDYPDSLTRYHNAMISEWISRGYRNTLPYLSSETPHEAPFWLNDSRVHLPHQSNLLRKDFNYYKRFGWTTRPNLPYYWAVSKPTLNPFRATKDFHQHDTKR